jgi:hypothetical protein
VSPRWLGHRPEPLLHERLWACPLVGVEDGGGLRAEAGFDESGRPVEVRYTPTEDGGEPYSETVSYIDGAVEVTTSGGTTVRTELDAEGRPERTSYTGAMEGQERYQYDAEGRIAWIEESPVLRETVGDAERDWTGGRLIVEHDDRGPVRIKGHYGAVWERVDEPWESTLEHGAEAIRRGVVGAVEWVCRETGVPPETEVFALALTYVDQGSLHPVLSFGLESDRRGWLESGAGDDVLELRLWYLAGSGEGLNFIDHAVIDDEMDARLLREAAIKQPGDPYRVVLGAAAALLARHDWSGLLTPTEDFVVFIAEHDEGIPPKLASVRAVNPPDRLEAWTARRNA